MLLFYYNFFIFFTNFILVLVFVILVLQLKPQGIISIIVLVLVNNETGVRCG